VLSSKFLPVATTLSAFSQLFLVGQNHKKVASTAGLPPPVWKWLRVDRDSGGIGRKAEGMLASIVDAGEHDGAEASSDFFGRACHGATIELDAVGFKLLLLPKEGHAESKLLDDDVRPHARREQPASNQQGRHGRGDDSEALAVLLDHSCVIRQRPRFSIRTRRLVFGAGEHHAHRFWSLVAEFVAQLPADVGAATFLKVSVANLNAALG